MPRSVNSPWTAGRVGSAIPASFGELAPLYLRAGYVAPIPLPYGRKFPPPSGITGHHNTQPPTAEQIALWCRDRGEDGIGFVLQDGWLLIDVDNYAKGEWPAGTGAATIARTGERAGCGLPPGPKMRNRSDGSEKRLFWVPRGLKFRKSLGPCVDLVTPTHRYVNAGINPDTGTPEQWFDAEDNPLGAPPPIETQRKLPDAWLALVIQGNGDDGEPASITTEEQAQAWLDGMPDGPMGALVQEEMDHALAGLGGRCRNPDHGARHDCVCAHVRWLVEMGAAGLAGVPVALKFLRARFVEATGPDRDGGKAEAASEFDSFVTWGARLCRPGVFDTWRSLEHTGFDGWRDGVEVTATGVHDDIAERELRITKRVRDLEERDEAHRRYAAQLWVPPSYPKSLYEQLAEGAPAVDYIMDGLWSGVLQVNAQKKSGKTTLMINSARSLVTGEPFLGRFVVNVEPDCRVAYLNMELPRAQFNNWMADMGVPDDAQKRIVPYHGRESGRLDFGNDQAVEWLIGWLRNEGVSIALLDPLGSFYDQPSGGDPNAAYLRWWAVLEDVILRAQLRGVWIGHHSGFSEDAANRARGASAMMDKPDVNMTYRYQMGEGSYTDAPVDDRRYLSAFGRDVDVKEFELTYHAPTRMLHASGRGTRGDAETERQAERIRAAVVRAAAVGEKPNKSALYALLGWETGGRAAAKFDRFYKHAIHEKRYVKTEPGVGREVLHVPGDEDTEWRVRLDRSPETDGEDQ